MPDFSVKTKIEHKISGVILGVVVLLAGIVIYSGWRLSVSRLDNLVSKEQPSDKGDEAKQMMVAEIIKSGDIGQCVKVQGLFINGIDYEAVCRSNIARNQAVKNLDPASCDQIDNALFSKDECKFGVTLSKALQTSDVSLCATLSEAERPKCQLGYWSEQAVAKNDIKLCANVAEASDQTKCQDQYYVKRLMVEPLAVDCGKLSETMRFYCQNYQTVMRSGKNCDDVSEIRLQAACRDYRAKK